MKIECPECDATVSFDEFRNLPAEHVCDECGACFEPESHLVFEETLSETPKESVAPLGE